MRQIIISMDVFAALWARRKSGEDSENAILERLLGLPKGPPLPTPEVMMRVAVGGQPRQRIGAPPWEGGDIGEGDNGGIFNRMFRVRFPEDFEIFRTYKGREFRARVYKGHWLMEKAHYPSLFALSMAVSDSNENPWMHWRYSDEAGQTRLIKDLRKGVLTTAPLPPAAPPRQTTVKTPVKRRRGTPRAKKT